MILCFPLKSQATWSLMITMLSYTSPHVHHCLHITAALPLSSASQEKAGTATVSCGHYEADSETTASHVPVVSLTFTH